MGERTLSFNTQMVEAILAGAKTQTRRLGEKAPAAKGESLWVRETHFIGPTDDGKALCTPCPDEPDIACYYRAGWTGPAPGRWRRSLYLPRWAARIFLLVTDVRAEELRDLTEEDARQEGIAADAGQTAVEAFASLWDSIYAERGTGWEANPRVWRVEFQLVNRPAFVTSTPLHG